MWPAVEIKWDADGNVRKDTFIELTNDYPGFVNVHLYFVNGDAPTAAIISQGQLIERAHPGWNNTNCILRLTPDQPTYWSALTGLPGGCQPFTALDDDTPPGRLDIESLPNRVLRGFIIGFAVNDQGAPINWNHLSGAALHVNYVTTSAWEYNAYAFQALAGSHGGTVDGSSGSTTLSLNGTQYEYSFDQLLLSYYASGSFALSGAGRLVQVDTDLTLMIPKSDLRQDTCGPVRTKARFVIHNMNEVGFSGTERCISCWDQTLFSRYARNANYLLRSNVQTDKAKARIDGEGSSICDDLEGVASNFCFCFEDSGSEQCDEVPIVIREDCYHHPRCAIDASLLGVQNKVLVFTGDAGVVGVGESGTTLVGQGTETAWVRYDIPTGPQPVITPGDIEAVDGETAVTPRTLRSVKGSR
jgi:hypothetical protein